MRSIPDAITQPAKVAQELIDQGMLDTDIAGIIKEPTEARINPRTGLVEHKINPMLRNRPNVLAVRIKGKDRFLFFSTEDARAVRMAESLKNLDAADLGGVWNLFRTVTRYVSSINTQYNPIFGVVNLIRDTQGGLLNLSSTPLAGQQGKVMANIGPALRGIYADLRADRKGQPRSGNEWSKLWEEFQQVGGKTGYRDMFRTAEDRGDALQKELQKAAEGKVKRFGRGVFDWLSDYNETLENAVRLSAYKAGIESGMTKDQSAVLAKDLTVNFNRKGQIASQMGSLYAFFNASAQGSVRLAQTLKGPAGKKIMAGGILLGVMQSVLMAMAGYDDDEPPEFVRERNFILPIGGGKYLTVPYPLGFHALPNMGRVVTDIALSGGRDGSKKVAGLLGSCSRPSIRLAQPAGARRRLPRPSLTPWWRCPRTVIHSASRLPRKTAAAFLPHPVSAGPRTPPVCCRKSSPGASTASPVDPSIPRASFLPRRTSWTSCLARSPVESGAK